MKRSKTVDEAVKSLYALLATAAAKKALYRVTELSDAAGGDAWAGHMARWLDKAGAKETRWTYYRPRV